MEMMNGPVNRKLVITVNPSVQTHCHLLCQALIHVCTWCLCTNVCDFIKKIQIHCIVPQRIMVLLQSMEIKVPGSSCLRDSMQRLCTHDLYAIFPNAIVVHVTSRFRRHNLKALLHLLW